MRHKLYFRDFTYYPYWQVPFLSEKIWGNVNRANLKGNQTSIDSTQIH